MPEEYFYEVSRFLPLVSKRIVLVLAGAFQHLRAVQVYPGLASWATSAVPSGLDLERVVLTQALTSWVTFSRPRSTSSGQALQDSFFSGNLSVCVRTHYEFTLIGSGSLTNDGCPISRSFFARCGIPLLSPSDSRFIRHT